MTTTSFSNCEHINTGWCLVCVSELNRELIAANQRIEQITGDYQAVSCDNAALQSKLNYYEQSLCYDGSKLWALPGVPAEESPKAIEQEKVVEVLSERNNLLEAVIQHCSAWDANTKRYYCRFCNKLSNGEKLSHKDNCITQADHPEFSESEQPVTTNAI